METKDYLDYIQQSFDSVQTARHFTSIMSKYIKPEQITVEGKKVTVHANNKAESWFLTLLTLNISLQNHGLPMPSEIMQVMVALASSLNDSEKADNIVELLESKGMTQIDIMNIIQEIKY